MLHLALSCLQGRPMAHAYDALARLGPDGLQLTPGNLVTEDFEGHVLRSGLPFRTHHGFHFAARKQPVWSEQGRCLVRSHSVHPSALALVEDPRCGPALETMYPGEALGTGAELERAMADGLPLAVDISHLYIQHCQGVLSERTRHKLLDYDRIVEVHVSANDGRRDSHRPIEADTFGLDWARARAATGLPVILESYFHKLDEDARRRQLDRLRG